MTRPTLSVIREPDTVSARVRRLQAEARSLAREHIALLAQEARNTANTAAEIAEGGDAYPAGVREEARKLAQELEAASQRIEAIGGRVG